MAALALCAVFLLHDPRRPHAASLASGWWSFSDQGRYLTSTLAWAAGNLQPDAHWYLPGYSLLAVPFVRVTPADPFLLPDAALLLASLWLTGSIAAELAPGWAWARALGAAAFLAVLAIPADTEIWVTPWTTTAAAPLSLGCLLALLRLLRRPESWRAALAAAGCAGLAVAIRPADAALLGTLVAVTGAVRLATAWPGWRAALRVALAAAAGVAVPAAVTGALYLAVYGVRLSGYLAYSRALGLEWRLLPLQWVSLVLDPQPMLAGGWGMIAVFPFLATGLAGMAACLAAPPAAGRRTAHLVVAAGVLGYGALYLCYRDLHPPGLWRFYNYHYFKWLLPVFALYTALLLPALRRPPAALAAVAVLAAVLPWRARLDVSAELQPAPEPGRRLALPAGLGVGTALVAAASGDFASIYGGENNFYLGPQWYGAAGSIAAYPLPGGLMLAPVRPLAPGPGYVVLDQATRLDPSWRPRVARLALDYGMPCYLPWRVVGCHSDGPIPPLQWPPGRAIGFGAQAAAFLVGDGWSPGGPDERWTTGRSARLRLQVRPAPPATELDVVASAFVPPGSPALTVALEANGKPAGRWSLADGAVRTLRARLPAGAMRPDGLLELRLRIADPRRPSDWLGTADGRELGLLVRSVTVTPAQ